MRIEIGRATQAGIATLAPERLRALAALFAGDFLEGLEIERSPAFDGWLDRPAPPLARLPRRPAGAPRRERRRTTRRSATSRRGCELAPFDRRAHEMLLSALARRGRIREGEEHLAATARLFEAEGLDCAPLRDAWRVGADAGGAAAAAPRRGADGRAGSAGDEPRDRCRAAPRSR